MAALPLPQQKYSPTLQPYPQPQPVKGWGSKKGGLVGVGLRG